MAFRAFVMSAAALALTTGCYFETLEDRSAAEGNHPDNFGLQGQRNGELPEGTCAFTFTSGCFDGYVAAMQDFSVDGKSFFNADDLAHRFHELVFVEGADGTALIHGEDYQVQLTTSLDNRSFYSGFSYDLVGDVQRHDGVKSGSFGVDRLPEGSYDLRVQRSVKFKILQNVAGEPDADGQPTVLVVEHGRCATLYVDTGIDIRRGQRTSENFDSFNMHVTDNECAADGNDSTITLHN